MLSKEPNYARKAQRVDLPLLVQINGKSYKAKDWSLSGVGILDLEITFEKDRKIDCMLVLPLQDAHFSLPASIVIKNVRGNITGCEFADLAPRNKRVLRRFIELAIEGQLDNVEDLIAVYSEPVIETPIQEALALEEKESLKIKRTFLKKSIAYLFVGFVALIVIGYTTIYNLQYKVFATGVVTGSFVRVTANIGGILDKIYVHNHDIVDPGLVLFDLTVSERISQPKPLAQNAGLIRGNGSPNPILMVGDLVSVLKERAEKKHKEYTDAEILYADRLITLKDFNIVYNNYLRAKIDYEREKQHLNEENERLKEKSMLLQKRAETVNAPFSDSGMAEVIKRRTSSIEGTVFRIEHNEGEYVHPDQTIMILQTREKPYVVVKLHSREIYKIKINDIAHIYSRYEDLSYLGRATQIGYAAVNADASISLETSLNESLVKIEFIDDTVEFPLNSRVEVRIKRDFLQR